MKFKSGDIILRKTRPDVLYKVLSTKNHYALKRITPTQLGRVGDFLMRTSLESHGSVEKFYRKPTKRERAELL